MTQKPEPRFNLAAAMAQRHGQPKPENKKYSLADAMRRQVANGDPK